jgi:hypothetical protein
MAILNNGSPIIALDWVDSLVFNPSSTQQQEHSSYLQLKLQKANRKDRITIDQCLDLMTTEVFKYIYPYVLNLIRNSCR